MVNRDAESVWRIVSDAPAISAWFPAITQSDGNGSYRTVTLQDGARLQEEVVTCDPALRRFQYRVVGGDLPIEAHLGTVDVLELGPRKCAVVYSTDIEPPDLADAFGPAIEEAVSNLARVASGS
ncbi:hypothetical protein FB384_003398 [Prauserella sediminis]|uniref:SRPBCC family protein n=1 Tax=Prauserella sediminis TaxID=577680 RepID=A0A839XST0_9PSEU|nr:hypothetical protein [Prauserella sediminis]